MSKILTPAELRTLVQRLKNCVGTEEEQDAMVVQLREGAIDPEIINYIFWSEMTAEEIVEKALAYRPILL